MLFLLLILLRLRRSRQCRSARERRTFLHCLFHQEAMGVCGGLLVYVLSYRLPLIQPGCHIASLQPVGRAFVPIPALLHPRRVLAGLEMRPLMMGVCQVCET